ncbi:hypothetical protein [Litorihabitans aurantiacus]|uniref:Uncharacterized protein n=1 Tax=Litorihabitans aurantiacus TaxID=1930061 RepID=A0AA37UTC5_9MICO|nr:hypothetical protein [Litorihabitans aurantiacus]GMA30875.1 hypothetical protein GCM10025875_08670 [Litorihabitans aurantiacus]
MTSSLLVLAQVAEEVHRPNPWLYGGLAFAILMLLLLATYAFRSVGTRRR